MPDQDTLISLESYAAVMAGLGAKLSLSRALEIAGVDPGAWEQSSQHWAAEIGDSAASDLSVLVAFDMALIAAKRRFEPKVEPIESELRPWTHFRRHYLTAVNPSAFLAERGLSLATCARIESEWANRALADESIATALRHLMVEPLEACPEITMKPSPWLSEVKTPPQAVVVEESQETPVPIPVASAQRRTPHVDKSPRLPAITSPPLAPPPVNSPPLANATQPVPLPGPVTVPPVVRLSDDMGTLTGVIVAAKGTVLPFTPPPATSSSAAPKPPNIGPVPSLAEGIQRPADLTGTADFPSEPLKPATPFASVAGSKKTASATPVDQSALPAIAQVPRPVSDLGSTMFFEPDLAPSGQVLPFDPNAKLKLPEPDETPVQMPINLAGTPALDATLPPGFTPTAPALPFEQASTKEEIATSPPRLTLEQYVWVRVELALYPSHESAIFGRYGIDAKQLQALDKHWGTRVREDPNTRALWNKWYAEHWTRLTGGKR